jgi:hypothetical protein
LTTVDRFLPRALVFAKLTRKEQAAIAGGPAPPPRKATHA